jgi:hypothetical protein
MKAYAQANDLPVDTFYAIKLAHARGPGKSKSARAPAPATFLPVQLTPPASREPLRATLPNGVRIDVPG